MEMSEVDQRLSVTLKGAFSGPPTPLKDIPKTRERKAKQKEKKTWDSSKEN